MIRAFVPGAFPLYVTAVPLGVQVEPRLYPQSCVNWTAGPLSSPFTQICADPPSTNFEIARRFPSGEIDGVAKWPRHLGSTGSDLPSRVRQTSSVSFFSFPLEYTSVPVDETATSAAPILPTLIPSISGPALPVSCKVLWSK